MRLQFSLILILLTAAAPCMADEQRVLKLRPKLAMAEPSAVAAPSARAPFVPSVTREEFPEAALRMEAESKYVPNSCSSTGSNSLCYDYKSGRTVYKPTRNWMPDVPGMRPESITMKRDKVAFNYSFK